MKSRGFEIEPWPHERLGGKEENKNGFNENNHSGISEE